MVKRILSAATLLVIGLNAVLAFAQTPIQLSMVRKIYIEQMDNHLDQYLASSISEKFHNTMTVVLERSQADAILRGVNITAQNTTRATVELVDPAQHVILWSGSAGDKSLMTLDIKHGGEQKIADHIIGQMKKAMQR
jgi:hypothetical protein